MPDDATSGYGWRVHLMSDSAPGPCGIRHPVDLRVNFLAQILPDILRHFEKDSYHVGIELPTGPIVDLFLGRLKCLLGPVNPIRSDGVERIGDGEDARSEGNLLSL